MKKLILVILLIVNCQLLIVATSFAQTPNATSSASPTEKEQEQIERIKDIVASRVAELKLVEKRGVLGTVESATSTQIALRDDKNGKRIIDIDEITEFNDPADENFGISDVKNGDVLGIIGLLNKGTDHTLARFVNMVYSIPSRIEGVIKSIDSKNFVVTAIDVKGKEQKIDINTSTKINVFDNTDSFIKSGFSKIKIGERVFVSGFIDSKDKALLNASRFIHFVTLAPSLDMKRHLESSDPTPTVDSKR